MLVNGKEVVIDLKKSQSIQDTINNTKDMPDFIKTEISKQQLKDVNLDNAFDVNNLADSFVNGNNFIGGSSNDDNRKNWYATFQEMSLSNFIHRGLQVICDDGCQKNEEGNTIKVVSDNEEIKNTLEELFHKRLNLNKELWSIFYETIKLGDNFYEVIPDSYEKPTMIARIRYLEPEKVNRVEVNNKLAFYTYTAELNDERTKQKTAEIQYRLQPWQIIHFKIEDKDFYPYGGSLLKSGVRTFRRLTMLEDAIMVYRLARVPERRVFKVDVGNLSTIEANRFIQKVRDNYRTQQIIDSEGKVNRKAAQMSITQDIFVPVREGSSGTDVTTLSGGNGLSTIEDLKFFRDEILLTMNIPPDYLGVQQDGGGQGRGSLAVLDSKFARFVERIQYYVEEGLTKLAFIELFFSGKKKEELTDFNIELTPPSNMKEIMDIEFVNQKMGLIQTMLSLNVFPIKYILKNVLRLSNKEINDIMLYKELEDQRKANMGAAGAAPMGTDIGLGGLPPDMGAAPAGPIPDMGAAVAPAPVEQPLNQETIVNVFGKDFLLENKEDFMKLIKASEDYFKNKNKIKEELVEESSNHTILDSIRELLIKENKKTVNSMRLFFEGEMNGIDFTEQSLTVFGNPRKKTGRKVPGQSDVIYEEQQINIKSGRKKKVK